MTNDKFESTVKYMQLPPEMRQAAFEVLVNGRNTTSVRVRYGIGRKDMGRLIESVRGPRG